MTTTQAITTQATEAQATEAAPTLNKYEIMFTRQVTTTDYFVRIIEAESKEAAQAKADAATHLYDQECPDDATESDSGYYDFGSWEVSDVLTAHPNAEVDDLPGDEDRGDDDQDDSDQGEGAHP